MFVKEQDSTTLIIIGGMGAIILVVIVYGLIHVIRKVTYHPSPHANMKKVMDDNDGKGTQMKHIESQDQIHDQFDPAKDFVQILQNQ